MSDTVTLDLDRISGLDVLSYWSDYGQHFPEGSPYRNLSDLAASWADGNLTDADRMLYAWLVARQNGQPGIPLVTFAAAVRGLPDLTDPAPDGADVDAPTQRYDGVT